MRRFLGPEVATDIAARIASDRVQDAGLFARKVLYPALLAAYTGAPSAGERGRDDDTAKGRVRAQLARFDAAVDKSFFVDLEAELAHQDEPDASQAVRAEWLGQLQDIGQNVLDAALAAAPDAAMRHYRTRVRALGRFHAAFHRVFGDRVSNAIP